MTLTLTPPPPTYERPSHAEFVRMFRRIAATDPYFVENANRAQEIVTMRLRTTFPSHDELFSYTEIAASFDDVATYDGWAVEE